MSKLLGDNIVSFMVDRSTEKWMGGYYLKNAKYRLDEVEVGMLEEWEARKNSGAAAAHENGDGYDEIRLLVKDLRRSEMWSDSTWSAASGQSASKSSQLTLEDLDWTVKPEVPEAFRALRPQDLANTSPPDQTWQVLSATLGDLAVHLTFMVRESGRRRPRTDRPGPDESLPAPGAGLSPTPRA